MSINNGALNWWEWWISPEQHEMIVKNLDDTALGLLNSGRGVLGRMTLVDPVAGKSYYEIRVPKDTKQEWAFIMISDEDCDFIVSGAGPGTALRIGAGKGDAIRTGDGRGHAVRGGSGAGDACRRGAGAGHALRCGGGDGCAIKRGTGAGTADRKLLQVSVGLGVYAE